MTHSHTLLTAYIGGSVVEFSPVANYTLSQVESHSQAQSGFVDQLGLSHTENHKAQEYPAPRQFPCRRHHHPRYSHAQTDTHKQTRTHAPLPYVHNVL